MAKRRRSIANASDRSRRSHPSARPCFCVFFGKFRDFHVESTTVIFEFQGGTRRRARRHGVCVSDVCGLPMSSRNACFRTAHRASVPCWHGENLEAHVPEKEAARAKQYTSESIQVLEWFEAIRKRPGMYVGDTHDCSGLHNMLRSLIEN